MMNVFQFGSFSLEESQFYQYPPAHGGGRPLPNGNGIEHAVEKRPVGGVGGDTISHQEPKSSFPNPSLYIPNPATAAPMASEVPLQFGHAMTTALVTEQPSSVCSSSERSPQERVLVKPIFQGNGGAAGALELPMVVKADVSSSGGAQVQDGYIVNIVGINQERVLGSQEASQPGGPTAGVPSLPHGATEPLREMGRDQRGAEGAPPGAVGPTVSAGVGSGAPSAGGPIRKRVEDSESQPRGTPKGPDDGEAAAASSSGAGALLPPPKPAAPRSWADLVGVQEQRRQGHPSARSTHAASTSVSRSWPATQAAASVPSGYKSFPSSSAPPSASLSASSSAKPTAPALSLSGAEWLERLQAAEGTGGPYVRPRGLHNTGNSCFLNATLQALLSLPPFLQLLHTLRSWQLPNDCPTLLAFSKFAAQFESVPESELHGGGADSAAASAASEFSPRPNVGRPLTPDFAEVLQRFTPGQPAHVGGGRTSRQEDAQEFLSFILDCMHEELLLLENARAPHARTANGGSSSISISSASTTTGDVTTRTSGGGGGEGGEKGSDGGSVSDDTDEWETVGPKNKTAVTRTHEEVQSALRDIFGGQLKSVIKSKGSKPSATVQPFLLLQLDVLLDSVHSVEDALHLYAAPEELDGYKGKQGKAEVVPAYKHVRFLSFPRVLVLHLMRFTYGAGGTGKVHKPIQFKEVLVVGKELMVPTTTVGKAPEMRRYELVATVSHHGKDPSGGHYTADTKQHNGQWLRFDDGNVSAVPLSRVLHDQAYLLVYKRQS